MEDRETARMRKYGESKMTRNMMATVPHVTSGLGELENFRLMDFCWHECTYNVYWLRMEMAYFRAVSWPDLHVTSRYWLLVLLSTQAQLQPLHPPAQCQSTFLYSALRHPTEHSCVQCPQASQSIIIIIIPFPYFIAVQPVAITVPSHWPSTTYSLF